MRLRADRIKLLLSFIKRTLKHRGDADFDIRDFIAVYWDIYKNGYDPLYGQAETKGK